MRRPVNAPYTITTEFGVPDSYAKFGRHSGVDYAVPLNRPVYAPVSGTVTNVVSSTGGNMVVIFDGQFYHRLMHNNSFSRNNGSVTEGEEVAKAGTTGLSTGVHSHWDINKEGTTPTSFAAFINPADWLAGKYQVTAPTGGQMIIQNADNWYGRCNKTHWLIRGRELGRPSFNTFVGKEFLYFVEVCSDDPEANKVQEAQQWALLNRAAVEKQIADLKVALANEQAKPPREVVKEVEKIVTKEVIKEVPVPADEKATVEGWLKRVWNSLFKKESL